MRRPMLVGLLLVVAMMLVAADVGDLLFVQVRDTELRSGPGFLAAIEQELTFGDEVSYVSERAGWYEVTASATGATGWVHAGAVEANRSTQIQLQGEKTSRTVTSREVALAGRGFNENLEVEYGAENEIDFGPVDELEAVAVNPREIVAFISDASLRIDFLQEAE